jgi:hypothetical protein
MNERKKQIDRQSIDCQIDRCARPSLFTHSDTRMAAYPPLSSGLAGCCKAARSGHGLPESEEAHSDGWRAHPAGLARLFH